MLPSDIQRDLVIVGRSPECAKTRSPDFAGRKSISQQDASFAGLEDEVKKDFDLPMSDIVYNILVTRRSLGREGEFVFPGYRRVQLQIVHLRAERDRRSNRNKSESA